MNQTVVERVLAAVAGSGSVVESQAELTCSVGDRGRGAAGSGPGAVQSGG